MGLSRQVEPQQVQPYPFARLKAIVEAMNTVRPALESFYASLSDEQKAKFNTMRPPANASAPPQHQSGG